jgi:glyoxylase-like metal-dependent hydrolase (beta-lactamase superfamily II)
MTILDYPFPDPPQHGEWLQVAPGVVWIRMPLPMRLDHINIWALEDGDGWTIVDTGMRYAATADVWGRLLTGRLENRPVKRVLVTHMHPDHIGMAGWLTRRFDCRLWVTRLEYLTVRMLAADSGREAPEDAIAFYHAAGWDAAQLEVYRARFGSFGGAIYSLPDSYRRISDGEKILIGKHAWRVIVGTGHSPEHACLYCEDLGVLISGDQVLPRISSNVSVFPTEPEANPLGDWVHSLRTLKHEVPNNVLVLPSHNECFRGLHERIDYLERHHHESLDRLRDALSTPKRVVDTFQALFGRLINGATQHSLATGESLAHLNYLIHRGEIEATIGKDGVRWYRQAPTG